MKTLPAVLLFILVGARAARADSWAERTLSSMTLEQKAGQLIMLSVYAGWTPAELDAAEKTIRDYRPGGLIFYGADPAAHAALLRRMRAAEGLPAIVAIDAEWGLGMRLDGAVRFPRNMTLGALRDDEPIRRMGAEVGRELLDAGIQMDLAPVVDVNNNPRNPVINERSFGENPEKVAAKGAAFVAGLRSAGALTCAKHFPGHGDTDVDSHLDLPRIPHARERFERVEWVPFKRAIAEGVDAVMTAHVAVPALEPEAGRPASLSSAVVTGILRGELGFAGLTISDALSMKAVANSRPGGQAIAEAALAGTDFLLVGADKGTAMPLFTTDVPDGVRRIVDAARAGRIPAADLDARVLRVLRAKERLGLDRGAPPPAADLRARLDSPDARRLKAELYRKALTLARDDGNLLPLDLAKRPRVAHLQIGAPPALAGLRNRLPWLFRRSAYSPFARALAARRPFRAFYATARPSRAEADRLLAKLSGYDAVVISLQGMTRKAADRYGLTPEAADLLARVRGGGVPAALVVFGNPYALALTGPQTAVLVAYEDDADAQEGAAEVLAGDLKPEGRLPVTASPEFPEGAGL